MKLEIELDMGKIDYDAINAQILEKVKELDITKTYDVANKIECKVNAMIRDEVYLTYDPYITNTWKYPSEVGRKLVETVTKELINEKVNIIVNEIIEGITEEAIKEMIVKLMPEMFVNAMISYLTGAIETSSYNMMNKMRDQAIIEAHNVFNSRISSLRY